MNNEEQISFESELRKMLPGASDLAERESHVLYQCGWEAALAHAKTLGVPHVPSSGSKSSSTRFAAGMVLGLSAGLLVALVLPQAPASRSDNEGLYAESVPEDVSSEIELEDRLATVEAVEELTNQRLARETEQLLAKLFSWRIVREPVEPLGSQAWLASEPLSKVSRQSWSNVLVDVHPSTQESIGRPQKTSPSLGELLLDIAAPHEI
ncbi:MAG: hypothetical protein R3C53_10045 [Pirellulaceae bacterium]